MAGQIFAANQSFSIIWEDRPLVVEQGTTAREGHPLIEAYPQFFTKLVPSLEHTPKPPAPAKATPSPAPVKRAPAAPAVSASPAVTKKD